MKKKIFIDGSEGTTGLRINERFAGRDDIEIIKIDPEKRKDIDERKKMINMSDITFLCLPDAASRESVSLVENEDVRVIDASTAHRTDPAWSYGLPELADSFRENIRNGKRIAVPGCYATGFMVLVYPLIAKNIIDADYPVSAASISGYSGAGKKTIAVYEDENRDTEYDAPRFYALSQEHKHLPEMQVISGLKKKPLFSPVIADYYSGMVVNVPLYAELMKKALNPKELFEFYSDYYAGEKFINVYHDEELKFLSCNKCSGWDGLNIFVGGNDERLALYSQFDNLGKGASGAAIQCMNIMLGFEEDKGLVL
ncbi:MAG: N-acetyl-gamma-glutamyl-phosphate reductase [Lachnospiraceae bacterium]|nr:N-acetyl-gamma-glutamyl-phosphate reductase [Lachnospiraceae bacterium]